MELAAALARLERMIRIPLVAIALLIALILALVSPSLARAMPPDEFQTLLDAIRADDFATIEAYLEPRAATSQSDPEYYVILLNYAYKKSRGALTIAQGDPREGELALTDPKTGEVVGFIGDRGEGRDEIVVDAIGRTRDALPGFRNRLDIHFGIVAVAERIERWDLVADQLVDMLETSRAIDNAWIWGPVGSMEGDPRDFMIQNLLPRTAAMFRAERGESDEALRRVSEALVEHYPDLVYGYANLGLLAIVNDRYAEARKLLERAREIDPEDPVVLGNLERLSELEAKKIVPAKAEPE